jgi:hypothetical protein
MFLFVIGIIIRIVPNIKIILTGTGRNIRDLFLCEQQQTIYIYIYILSIIFIRFPSKLPQILQERTKYKETTF